MGKPADHLPSSTLGACDRRASPDQASGSERSASGSLGLSATSSEPNGGESLEVAEGLEHLSVLVWQLIDLFHRLEKGPSLQPLG